MPPTDGSDADLRALQDAVVDTLEVERGSASVLSRMFGVDKQTRVGRYLVLEKLGAGATAAVYRAYDPVLRREVALKILRTTEAAEQWVLQEGQSLAQLSHPNVVQIYDLSVESGRAYLAMEYVDGQSLAAYLREARPWRTVVALFASAGRGLHAAHERGIIHRDFKPANVLVGNDGAARVVDFGLARTPLTDESAGSASSESASHSGPRSTQPGTVAGTPAYMAPEQHAGGALGPASDQFSFCVSLFEGVYGVRPFPTERLAAAKYEADIGAPPGDSSVPRRLRRAILRGLRPKPEERWPSMAALVAELDALRNSGARRAAGVAALAIGAGTVASLVAAPEPCPDPTLVASAWNETKAGEVRARFVAAAPVHGAEAAQYFEHAVNEYAHAWTDQWRDNCEATRVRGEQSEERNQRRVDCLADAARDLSTVVKTVSRPDVDGVRTWSDAVAWLPAVARCDGMANPREPVGPPADAVEDVAALNRAIRETDALIAAGAAEAARKAADDHHARAEAIGYEPLLARAKGLLARVGLAEAAFSEALADATESYFLATKHRESEIAFDAAIFASRLSARQADYAAGFAWARHAAATLGPRAEESIEMAEATLAMSVSRFFAGEFDEALRLQTAALEVALRTAGPEASITLTARKFLSMTHGRMGHADEAVVNAEAATAAIERRAGPRDIDMADAWSALALAYANANRYEDCLATVRRAIEVASLYYPPDHAFFFTAQQNVGMAQAELSRFEPAALSFAEALRIGEAAYGADHPQLAVARLNLARAKLKLGDAPTALAIATDAGKRLEGRTSNAALDQAAQAELVRGEASLAIPDGGDTALAAATAAERLAASLDTPEAKRHLGDALMIRAHALANADDDDGARAAAEAAKREFSEHGASKRVERARRFLEDRDRGGAGR